jgi:ABC-type transport system substrate-binding protein
MKTVHRFWILGLVLALAGCGPKPPAATKAIWLFGSASPPFDPTGPPEFRRWAIERLLTRGLVEEDSVGRVVPVAAQAIEVSQDSLTYTFHLRPDLRFTDGSECRSRDFVRALTHGLERKDHQTWAWALSAVHGMERFRAGRALPDLGFEAPDDQTLVIRLARRDRDFLARLAVPGITWVWNTTGGSDWTKAPGLGPYRVLDVEPGRRLRMVRASNPERANRQNRGSVDHEWVARTLTGSSGTLADTLVVRFAATSARARGLLREGSADWVWPLPPAMVNEATPASYRMRTETANPRRTLELVLRLDVPPTTRREARRALSHGISRGEVLRLLGLGTDRRLAWVIGGGPASFPAFDRQQALDWMERGKFTRSFRVTMAYRNDGPGIAVARSMQEEWASGSIYVEPRPLAAARFEEEALTGQSQLLLIEHQPLLGQTEGELAQLVMPAYGPPVGAFRTGWRTRDFDRVLTSETSVATDALERRLAEEMVVLPLARLDWAWVERASGPRMTAHPRFGPTAVLPARPTNVVSKKR